MPRSRTTWSLLIGLALGVMLLVIGVVPRLRQNAELVAASTAPDAGVVSVGVVPPKRADGPIDLVLPSNIQAIEETAIHARTSGYVRERYVDIGDRVALADVAAGDRKSTRLNSSHDQISYAVFCLKKKK